MKLLHPLLPWFALTIACSGQTAPQHAAANGILDPSTMSGADIGAKVNAALATISRSGGTVRIPAGEYNFSTTIKLTHAGQHLVCDPGAVLRYSGNSDAILVDTTAGGGLALDIDGEGGCQLLGTPSAQNGIHLLPGNTFAIRDMRLSGFSKGNGIELSGANNVQIVRNVDLRQSTWHRHGDDSAFCAQRRACDGQRSF